MPMLHDDRYRAGIQQRLRELRPDAQRRWGKMTVAQMLKHVNVVMESALGKISVPPEKPPLPRPIMKFIVINIPWPKGAPTIKPFVVTEENCDFEAERVRCLRLIDELASKNLESEWPPSPMLGQMSGRDVTRLHAKHLNHHLTQFGA
jgi:uncharacterized protein DUF1569